MAKSAARTRQPQKIAFKRKVVVRDEKLLSPILVDFSTLVFAGETVIHDFFQTTLPVTISMTPDRENEAAINLVARFAYSPAFLKALTSLLVRQYAASEAAKGKKLEAISWLKLLLQQAESGGSTEPSEPSTTQ
jgi:hypothetical protein